MASHPTTFTGRKKVIVAMIPLVVLSTWFGYIYSISRVLPSTEKYPGGGVKAHGYVQRERMGEYRRTGHWVLYHANGKKASEGAYTAGQQTGEWKFWNEEGEVMPSVNYQDGKATSPASPHVP